MSPRDPEATRELIETTRTVSAELIATAARLDIFVRALVAEVDRVHQEEKEQQP